MGEGEVVCYDDIVGFVVFCDFDQICRSSHININFVKSQIS